ncbi:MAG: hypothetical protein Q8882_06760 [Bacillota bacterium]|nr:hypothetical protein [Bacillota bacterium]
MGVTRTGRKLQRILLIDVYEDKDFVNEVIDAGDQLYAAYKNFEEANTLNLAGLRIYQIKMAEAKYSCLSDKAKEILKLKKEEKDDP